MRQCLHVQTITAVLPCFQKYAYVSPNNCVQRQFEPWLAHEFWEELMYVHLEEVYYDSSLFKYIKYTHNWPFNGPLLWVTNHCIQCNNVTSHLKSTLSFKVRLNTLFQFNTENNFVGVAIAGIRLEQIEKNKEHWPGSLSKSRGANQKAVWFIAWDPELEV